MKNKVIRLSLEELINVFIKQLDIDTLIDLMSIVFQMGEELSGKDIDRLKAYSFKTRHNKSRTAKKCRCTRKAIEKLIVCWMRDTLYWMRDTLYNIN
jgi:energy-converting hydrogenase A subunit M